MDTELAVAAAVAAGRAQGLRVDEPVVLRDLTNILVRLKPSPVVAHVPVLFTELRGRAWFVQEVALARFLAGAGAPVAPPVSAVDPGPHEHDGVLVTLWDHVDHDPARFDAGAAGRSLRELHDVLASYSGPLPHHDRLDEVGRVIASLRPSGLVSEEELERLAAAHERLGAEARTEPGRPLHGDAHLGNILWSAAGPCWTDLENACTGPVEYDLACIEWRGAPGTAEALAAYGAHDGTRVESFFPGLALFLAVWTLVIAARRPLPSVVAEARRRVERALDYAREM
jgi:hypothetical protein